MESLNNLLVQWVPTELELILQFQFGYDIQIEISPLQQISPHQACTCEQELALREKLNWTGKLICIFLT